MPSRSIVTVCVTVLAALAIAAAPGAAAPRQPTALPQVGASFAASYDAVWDATLRGLGVVKLVVADKAAGRIQTEPYTFIYPTGPGQEGNTQILSVALHITVQREAQGRTTVQVIPHIHDSLLLGFTPGPTNNPWSDLFGKIATYLGARG